MTSEATSGGSRPLEGRVFIVTGAGRGLGRQIAIALGRAGAKIACAARSAEQLEETVKLLQDDGTPAIAVPTDVTSWPAVENLVAQTLAEFGDVYGLVANAGGGVGAAPVVEDVELADWDATIQLNLTGTFYCAKAVIPHLRRQGRGTIITVSSGNAFRGESRLLAYSSAKAGVVALTMGLATSLASDGVNANCIVPGVFVTAEAEEAGRGDGIRARGRFIPAGRVGEGPEIGPLAVFLASDAASYITGEAIALDGGGLAGGLAPIGWDFGAGA